MDETIKKFYRTQLGGSAKGLIKYLKKNGDLRRFRPFRVFANHDTEASDIVGHLFLDAFQGNAEMAVSAYEDVENRMCMGRLPASILDDLSGLNDAKYVKNRRRSYIKLLREFSDWALEEGQFDPKLYVEVE